MPLVLTDARHPDNPIILANRSFLNLTGYASNEILGRNCRFLQGENTDPSTVGELRKAIASEMEATIDILNYRKDGTPFWNELHISPIRDEDKRIAYYFASQLDVTDFRKMRELEASERRLLMEVDHRARNALAIVDSIVRLSRSSEPAAYAQAVQRRVHSISTAHTLLSEAGWVAVDLHGLILAQVPDARQDIYELRGPVVSIAPDAVQPLSLAFHELATNAMMHGPAVVKGGATSITWEVDPTGGVNIAWAEGGRHFHGGETREGFGTKIVRALLQQQLQGQVAWHWRDDGLFIEIRVPRASVHSL
jgi:PAS domain S-box-containing protein